MNRTRSIGLFLIAVLSAIPLFSQEPIEGANVYGDLSYARTSLIFESRRLAYQELAEKSSIFASPDIATALSFPSYLIAVARITAVQLPNGGSIPHTRISFQVEQILRGKSEAKDFDVDSQWAPMAPPKNAEELDLGGFDRRTVLDRHEPQKEDRYILGYSLDYGDGKTVFIPSAIDMQDPGQAQLIDDVERFLAIESAAGSGFEPYLEALDSSIPWIREIAIHRLTASDACNASPVCTQRFAAVVRSEFQSKIPNDRLEASNWLLWIESVSRSKNAQGRWSEGLPILPDSVIRQLWTSAIDDPNVYIGDEAFERREMFDFYRGSTPGACIQVVPALRKSAHWLPGEHDYSGHHELLPLAFPLGSMTSCIPMQKSQSR